MNLPRTLPSAAASVLCLLLCAGLLTPAGAGAAPDNSLACQLVANSVVKKALGVSHVERVSTATSPTAPAPYDHTVDGADQSICEIFGFDHKPGKSLLKQLSKPRKPVPAGFGRIDVTTEVRDEEPNGEGPTWNPKEALHGWIIGLHSDLKALGGADFGSPNLGAYIHAAYWLGNPDRTAGYYLVGDGGAAGAVVVFNVLASQAPTNAFATIAKNVVPPFTEIALTP